MGKNQISIRPCRKSDCRFLWTLRNEKSARESAFNRDYIAYSRHVKWFRVKMSNKDSHIFIVLKENKRVGQARLDKKSRDTAEVDVGILKSQRGRGFGSCAIRLASIYGLNCLGLKNIVAYVKKENAPSFKAFKKSKFSNRGILKVKREPAYKMVLR